MPTLGSNAPGPAFLQVVFDSLGKHCPSYPVSLAGALPAEEISADAVVVIPHPRIDDCNLLVQLRDSTVSVCWTEDHLDGLLGGAAFTHALREPWPSHEATRELDAALCVEVTRKIRSQVEMDSSHRCIRVTHIFTDDLGHSIVAIDRPLRRLRGPMIKTSIVVIEDLSLCTASTLQPLPAESTWGRLRS